MCAALEIAREARGILGANEIHTLTIGEAITGIPAYR
jgi:hypothetical protein